MARENLSLYFYYTCGHMGRVTTGARENECVIEAIQEDQIAEHLKAGQTAKMYFDTERVHPEGMSHIIKGKCPACKDFDDHRNGALRSHVEVVKGDAAKKIWEELRR
ncbi:hypothetical protein TWF694_005199 [Orbilia ellipsospora]|uniref:Uncharacterized protein n=1 Tax=Orbilia ellipsospora TaxID=2528407 RepID=A0AAV9WV05_9PEZI